MLKRQFPVIISIAILAAFSSVAAAQTRAGLVKIHLDTSLFGFGVGEEDYDNSNLERDYDQITVGLGTPSAGIGGGYTIIDGLVVGGKVTLALDGWDKYHYDSGGFTWSVMPYVEYIWLAGIFRPFVMGTLGFEGFVLNDDDTIDQDKNWWNFTFGAGGGAHFFLYDRISLDATLLFTFGVGTGERETATIGGNRVTADFSHWRFLFMTLIGISVWL